MLLSFGLMSTITLINAQIAGNYHSEGYFYHPTSPRVISVEKTLYKQNDSTYTTGLADLGGGNLCLNIHKNNSVSFETSYYDSGTKVPVTAIIDSVNTFDPVNRVFNIHYQYTVSSGHRYVREILTHEADAVPNLPFFINGISYFLLNSQEATLIDGKNSSGSVTIPEKVSYNGTEYPVVSISDQAFYTDSMITNIVLPPTIISIGYNSFGLCKNLSTINLPISLQTIGDMAFQQTKIESFSIPASVTYLGVNPFETGNLSNIEVDLNNSSFKVIDGVLFDITCKRLIACPQTKAGSYTIPISVKVIGDESFAGCSDLSEIIIPEYIDTIGNGAFRLCKSIENINIPNYIMKIGYGAFYRCTSLKSVSLPLSLNEIEDYTFSECTNLKTVIIPYSIETIGQSAFYNCTSLTNVNLSSVNSIGVDAFYNCRLLTTIEFPSTLKTLSRCAFSSCTGLINVFIPNTVTTITGNPFPCCNLYSLNIDYRNPNYSSSGNVIYSLTYTDMYNYKLNSIVACTTQKTGLFEIPASVTSIDDYAFAGCNKLTSISIPNGVKNIGTYAFDGCTELTSISFPETLTYIRGYSLKNCTKLSFIDVLSTNPPIMLLDPHITIGEVLSVPVYVPAGTLTSYKSASGWKEFINITELTRIKNIKDTNIKYYTVGNQIIITGLKSNSYVQMYDINGKNIINQYANNDKLVFTVPAKGVYLVRCNDLLIKTEL